MLTSDIENFPGYPNGIEGPHMMKDLKEQVMNLLL
jgi:thioredoxin reductase